ncbi:MAG: hypothetical protein U9O18_10340 [Chloroflexota bacterium]|nr:hypothetical protein [Chloroflexota bacterium]
MTAQTNAFRTTNDRMLATRHGVIARLADPYLTDHDRWVLRQFAQFLGGVTPNPDPRVTRVRPERPLYTRVRRSSL